MGLGDLSPWHLLIIAAVVMVLFGARRLPGAAQSLGQAMRIFKKEAQKLHEDDASPAAVQGVTSAQLPPPAQAPQYVPDASATGVPETPRTNLPG